MPDTILNETAGEPLVKIRGLSKAYSNDNEAVVILKYVDFDVAAGETVALVGASGLGKATFVHFLGTLENPDEGTIHLNGVNVFAFND